MEVLKMVGGVWDGGTENGWWSVVLKMIGGVWCVGWRYLWLVECGVWDGGICGG